MNRNTNSRFVKPMLEELEERAQPSFLSDGLLSATGPTTIQQNLVPPLKAMFADMQGAKTDLQTQFKALTTTPTTLTVAQAETAYAEGAADYQRMLNNQHAIEVTVTGDIGFIRAAAFAEAMEGNPTDAIILFFGPAFGLNPESSLTNVETQANNLISGSDVLNWVSTDFQPTAPSGFETTATWAEVTVLPSF